MTSLSPADFWLRLEMSELAMFVGGSIWFPILHSLHVLSACLMLGFILMLDLRLMGLAARAVLPGALARDLLPWTLGAFLLALGSGILMFLTRAGNHVQNSAFQWKMLLLLLAGVNMLVYHWCQHRWRQRWEQQWPPPLAVRLSGMLSLALWVLVMLAGRWIGHIFG